MQIASFLHLIVLSVACLAVPYSSTLSHKRHDFRITGVESKMCVLILSKLLSEIFHILRRIQRDVVINVRRLHVRYPLFFSDFNQN
jgi:hypothetical protein